jgi:hypothetical protein
MRWALVVLAGCGRIGFDAFGAGDAAPGCPTDAALVATHVVNPGDDLFGLLGTLVAGDVVVVHAGTYSHSTTVSVTLNGTATQPILIEAAPGEQPVLSSASAQNVLEVGGSYYTFRGLEFTGGNVGIRVHATTHATFDTLLFTGLVNEAITANFTGEPCDHLLMRRLEVVGGAQTAIDLGNFDGTAPTTASTVEGSYIHDAVGPGIADAPGCNGIVVADNVIARMQKVAIDLQGFTGAGTDDMIERNLIWTVTADNGIQVEGHVTVQNNIVLDANGYGIASFQTQTPPDGAKILHNTVWCGSGARAFYAGQWDVTTGQVLANNALYCPSGDAIFLGNPAASAMFAANAILGTNNAPSGTLPAVSEAADLGDPQTGKVFPPLGSVLIDGGAASAVVDDFDGNPRDATPDIGAYERGSATGPAWPPAIGFKPLPAAAACN